MTADEMTEADLAWLAGLLEGEGCFCLQVRRATKGDHHSPKIVLKMVDEDVVRRAHVVAGVGNVTGPYSAPSKPAHHQPTWCWQVCKQDDVVDLIEVLQPLMGERRHKRIGELLDVVS